MEKLIVKTFKYLTLAAVAAFSFTANAGTPFRMHAKAPVHKVDKYIFGYGGVNLGSDYHTTGSFLQPGPGNNAIPLDWSTEAGFNVGGGIGVYSCFLGGSRFEIEGSYGENTIDAFAYNNVQLWPSEFVGQISTATVMVNFLKEVSLGKATGYFGGGIGGANSQFKGNYYYLPVNERDGGFAWQLIAGVDLPINDCIALFTQYKFQSIHGIEYNTVAGDFPFSTDEAITSHSVQAGLRFSF